MIFIDNIYSQNYYNIIHGAQTRAKSRKEAQMLFPETVIEKHHIIPESFYINRTRKGPNGWLLGNPNDKENLVYLTAREHFNCHKLLIDMTLLDQNYVCRAKKNMIFSLVKLGGAACSENEYEQARKLLSISQKAHVVTVETRNKLSMRNLGKKHSDKTKAKMKASAKNRPVVSEETRKKHSASNKARGPRSQETKDKIKKAHLGKIMGPMSDSQKEKISAALTGKPKSAEHRHNLSIAGLNKIK